MTHDSECILVLAPRDEALAVQAAEDAGLQYHICKSTDELCHKILTGAGAALVAEDALSEKNMAELRRQLAEQPPWSDFPFVVLSSQKHGERPVDALAEDLNVTILDRPIRARSAVSALLFAIRTRRRQYEARRAIHQRDQFLAVLGHELRNPLGAVVLASSSMNEAIGDDPLLQKTHAVIERQTKHLARLVDELLDVARMTSGKVILRKGPLDLVALVSSCVQTQESALSANRLSLSLSLPKEPILIDGDAVRVEQVVTNILTNAVKYTPPGGHITLVLMADAQTARIVVSDDGPGIAPDLLSHVFDLFAQAENTLARSRGGLGIGLTIVRQLVELHGGTVSARSEGLGRGSEFTATFPRLSRAKAPPVPAPDEVSNARHHIVVVEDNDDAREGLRELLTKKGHAVDVAGDGQAGAELILSCTPDVAFIDIGLPGIDGYEVARRVRQRAGQVPMLIALTGYGQAEDRQRALDAGFDVHMTKPIDMHQLDRVLGTAFFGHADRA